MLFMYSKDLPVMVNTAHDHIPACVFELRSEKNVEMSYILICPEYAQSLIFLQAHTWGGSDEPPSKSEGPLILKGP